MTEQQPKLSDAEQDNALFLLQLLTMTVGGEPSLALGTDKESNDKVFSLVSTCPCDSCVACREEYPNTFSKDLLTAARRYSEDRVEFSTEAEKASTAIH